MAKRSDTTETALLAIELLRRIPRTRKVTAAELHAQLKAAGIERELRTIQRQLEMLSRHFDIERDERSKPYGYRWLKDSRGFALPGLGTQESLLLQLSYEHLKNLLPTRVADAMEGFFDQARRNLADDGTARRENEWISKVRVVATSQPLLPPVIESGVFEAVSEALYDNRWLHLDYRNASGRLSRIEVMPLGLAQQGPRLYLVCRYRGYDNERSLALHRMSSAVVSTLGFERPQDFDLRQYDNNGRFGFGEGERVKLSFHVDKDHGLHLLESRLSADQQVEEFDDGTFRITATVVDSAMLDWWLRGFGDAVKDVVKNAQDAEKEVQA